MQSILSLFGGEPAPKKQKTQDEGSRNCPCGEDFLDDKDYCLKCGVHRKCECGNEYYSDSTFCRMCGKKRQAFTLEDGKCPCGNTFLSDSICCRKCGHRRKSVDVQLPLYTGPSCGQHGEEPLVLQESTPGEVSMPIEQQTAEPEILNEKATASKLAASALEVQEDHGRDIENKYGAIFDSIDIVGAGVVSPSAVQKYIGSSAESKAELGIEDWQTFVNDVDANGDGKIDRLEFVAYFTHSKLDKNKCFDAIFDAIDVSKDGKLQYDEVRDFQWYKHPTIFQLLGVADFTQMASEMDEDGDGEITKAEFVNFMNRKQSSVTSAPVQAKPVAPTATTSAVIAAPSTVSDSSTASLPPPWKKAAKAAADWESQYGWKKPQANANKGGIQMRDGKECWNYTAGYCSRGRACHWKHIDDVKQDQASLNAYRQVCSALAYKCGIKFNEQAMLSLQTLAQADAELVIRSVAAGGDHAYVKDKNFFIIHEVRRIIHMKSASADSKWQTAGKSARA